MYSTLFDMPIWIVTYLILIADYFEASHDEYNVICTNNNSFRHFSITSVFFLYFTLMAPIISWVSTFEAYMFSDH